MSNTEQPTAIAAARIIPGDKLVIRSAYGDKAWPVEEVYGSFNRPGMVTVAFRANRQTVTRQYRTSRSVEVIACDGDRD